MTDPELLRRLDAIIALLAAIVLLFAGSVAVTLGFEGVFVAALVFVAAIGGLLHLPRTGSVDAQ